MAGFIAKYGTYRNAPVYRDFEYLLPYKDFKDIKFETLSPVWTASGLLIPDIVSDTPAYICIPREECIKMLNDLLNLDAVREICNSLNKRTDTAVEKAGKIVGKEE